MLKSYAVLAVGIALILVSSFSLVVNAQTTQEPTVLDQIMSAFLQIKLQESSTAVTPEPTVTPGPTIGASQRPDVIITKYLDYDDITTSGVQITASTTGSFVVDNIFAETGANTMASGTLFQIYSLGNTFATSTTLFSTQVNNFPKATAMNLDTAISTSGSGSGYASSTQRIVLDDGGALWAKCTGASCKLSQVESEIGTAGKNMRITVILKPTDTGSSIYE
mgnify:CR=1 FL=1